MHDTAEDNGLTDLSKNKRRLLTPLPPFSSSGQKQKLKIDRKWWNNNLDMKATMAIYSVQVWQR